MMRANAILNGTMCPRALFLLLMVFFFAACEDELSIKPVVSSRSLVVEGWIEQGEHPRVILTRSMPYFTKLDSSNLRDMVVTIAKVTVSCGGNSEILTLMRNPNYFPPFLYQGTEIKGEAGKIYDLKVELSGQTYTASATIPAPVGLDSLWYEPRSTTDTAGVVQISFTDPPEPGNYYRIFTQRLHTDRKFIPIYISALSDDYFNGRSFDYTLYCGTEALVAWDNDLYFAKGDTINVKFCTTDRANYEFWRTAEREIYTASNPFSSAANRIISNISNGAKGVWGGYSATYYTVVAK